MDARWCIVVLICWLASGAEAGAAENCLGCHSSAAAALHGTPHAPPAPGAERAAGVPCGACHRDAESHAAAPPAPGGMLTFEGGDMAGNSACAACHRSAVHPASAHMRAGVACSDCHDIHRSDLRQPLGSASAGEPMGDLEATAAGAARCESCHADVMRRFAHNERHPVTPEGCGACHDPHGAGEPFQLGEGSSGRCARCHASLAGPFVFEHATSTLEGCTACHAPHGSPNRHLLTHQEVGALCYQCHGAVPAFHLGFVPGATPRFGLESVCTNCHVTIHGSNVEQAFLR